MGDFATFYANGGVWMHAISLCAIFGLAVMVERFNDAEDAEKKDFRSLLGGFVRTYAFLSQIITFTDTDLEKLYWFGKALLPQLKGKVERLPVEVQQSVDMESFRLQETSAGKIGLERGEVEIAPKGLEGGAGGGRRRPRHGAPGPGVAVANGRAASGAGRRRPPPPLVRPLGS